MVYEFKKVEAAMRRIEADWKAVERHFHRKPGASKYWRKCLEAGISLPPTIHHGLPNFLGVTPRSLARRGS